jgi:hypothetical protein
MRQLIQLVKSPLCGMRAAKFPDRDFTAAPVARKKNLGKPVENAQAGSDRAKDFRWRVVLALRP